LYREITPPPALAPVVECFWSIRSGTRLSDVRRNRVLPDGCSDIIFNFGDPTVGEGNHQHLRQYVVGIMRTAAVVGVTGFVDLFGVRFHPGAAQAVTDVRGADLAGRIVALDDLVPDAGAIASRLAEDPLEERVAVLANVIERRIRRGMPLDPRVRFAAGAIERTHGSIPIRDLAMAAQLTRRHLERLFAQQVGSTPKEACRVARFRTAVRRLNGSARASLARVAHQSGYHDQSHLHRDFVRLAGITPAAYRRERDVASVQDEATEAA